MSDILDITKPIPEDDSIYEYEYKEYNPIVGTNYTSGSVVITIEAQDIYTHPSESFLIIDGWLEKADGSGRYANADIITLINNGMMYLFSDVRYHLASHEIEVLQNPGHATTMLGMLKYTDDFSKSQGLNQLWAKDTTDAAVLAGDNTNHGFKLRHDYIINTAEDDANKGNFSFKIPLKHFLGFCEDYTKVLYGMQQRLTLTLANNDNPIFKAAATDAGKVVINKIRWFMSHVIPSDAQRLALDKLIVGKAKIPVGYRMLQCDSVTVGRSSEFTCRLGVKSSPDIPRFIIVGFQYDKSNNQESNPAIFDRLNIRNIYVTLNAKRYPDIDYEISFPENRYSRVYGDAVSFRKKFYNMDELISNPNITPNDYKKLFPLFLFDVSKQSEKLKTSVSDIHIKAFFNTPVNNKLTIAYAVIISDRIFHFVSDGSKISNII